MKSIGHEVAGIYASRNGNETNHQVTSPLENEKRERSEKNTRKFGRFILLFSQLKRLLFFFQRINYTLRRCVFRLISISRFTQFLLSASWPVLVASRCSDCVCVMAVTHGADVQARAAARRPIKFINETTWSTSFILFSWLYTSLIF